MLALAEPSAGVPGNYATTVSTPTGSDRGHCKGKEVKAMSIENRTYFRDRAEQELAAAAIAANPSIGAIHADLAKLYHAQADGPIQAGEVSTLEALLVAAFCADEDGFHHSRHSGQA